jgi:hypothetical protein
LPRTVGIIATELGSALAEAGHGLVVGGWPGVDYLASESHAAVNARRGYPLSDHLIQVVGGRRPEIYPSGANYPDFRGGHVVEVPSGVREWIEALKYSDAVILLGGEGGTLETFQYAVQEQRLVLPVASTEGDAAIAFRDCIERWETLPFGGISRSLFQQVLSTPVALSEDARELAKGILGLLEVRFGYEASEAPLTKAIFVSYAHEDRHWMNKLRSVLRPLERTVGVSVWDDHTLGPGARFEREIHEAIATARVAILLVSDAFLESSFIREKELPWLRDRQAGGAMTILWLPVQGSSWSTTFLAEVLAVAAQCDVSLETLPAAHQQDALVKVRNAVSTALAQDQCRPTQPA